MAEAYCDKCKARKEMIEAAEEEMKSGRKAIKGRCPDCGTSITKVLGSTGCAQSPPNS